MDKYPDLDVILTEYVEGLGNVGEKVSVRPFYAYKHLLLPGLAVYATPENLEKYVTESSEDKVLKYSSATALLVRIFSCIKIKHYPLYNSIWRCDSSDN